MTRKINSYLVSEKLTYYPHKNLLVRVDDGKQEKLVNLENIVLKHFVKHAECNRLYHK